MKNKWFYFASFEYNPLGASASAGTVETPSTWRMRPNVTVNLGVRYEFTTVPFTMRLQTLNQIASVPGLISFNEPQPPVIPVCANATSTVGEPPVQLQGQSVVG